MYHDQCNVLTSLRMGALSFLYTLTRYHAFYVL